MLPVPQVASAIAATPRSDVKYSIQKTQSPQGRRKERFADYSNQQKAAHLAQETGIELILAQEFLESNNWNLEKALIGYKEILKEEEQRSKKRSNNQKSLAKSGRGFSESNIQLLSEHRAAIDNERKKSNGPTDFPIFDESSRENFVLPNISLFNKELGDYIRQDLICISSLQALSSEGRLNWWAELGACRKLFPMFTVGDGNCLLHAASLGMWGFQDRLLTLRKMLFEMFSHPASNGSLRRRWKYKLWQENMKFGGLNYTVEEWEKEWQIIVKLSSDRPRLMESGKPSRRISRTFSYRAANAIPEFNEGECLDSLEPIHVYGFSNLLCRPIIVISEEMLKDSSGNALSPIPFGGIYLPLERDPESCYKYPLVLAYNNAHFSALVAAEGEIVYKGERLSNSVPLYDSNLFLLPIHFAIDPGSNWDKVKDDSLKEEKPELTYEQKIRMLRQYLDVIRVPMNDKDALNSFDIRAKRNMDDLKKRVNDMFAGQPLNEILAAKLNTSKLPKFYKEMISNYIESSRRIVELQQVKVTCAMPNCNTVLPANTRSSFCDQCCALSISMKASRGSDGQIQQPRNNTDEQPRRSTVPILQPLNSSRPGDTLVSNINNMALTQPSPPQANHSVLTQPAPPEYHSLMHEQSTHLPPYDSLPPNNSQQVKSNTVSPRSEISSTTVNGNIDGIGRRCLNIGCKFYGSDRTKGYCSGCYRNQVTKK